MRRMLIALVLLLAVGLLPAGAAPAPQPAAPYHDSTVLVRVAEGVRAQLVHRLAGVGRVANTIPGIGVDVVVVPPGTVEAAVAVYSALPEVEFAEPNHMLSLLHQPDDPRFAQQYALHRIETSEGWAAYDPEGAFATTGGAVLAVVDSGIDLTHPEFDGKVIDCRGWLTALGIGLPTCQENNVHGTHVSGIAAAATNNGVGIAGVAYDAEIMALQACTYTCFAADTAAAIVYAADNGAQVANYSFGGGGASSALGAAVEHAAAKGVLQIGAAGNDGAANSVNYPAAFPEVVAVSSTTAGDTLSGFSSYGPQVEVAAPGSSIISTAPAHQYLSLGGTSMASPHVAGLGALLRAMGLDADQARAAIIAGAELVGGADGWTERFGHGRINVARSIQTALDILADA